MSLGYAEKLSYREDVGEVGMSEIFDSPQVLQEKIKELATMIRESKSLVAFTGAGISTSCGIPDFRGPKGVWTLQREGKGVPEASIPFDRAMPTLTHMALVELERAGILKFVISQNVDSLHLRSGIPRDKLSELHGNSFREICPSCGLEYVRDFEIETIGMKKTSRHCSDSNCRKKLKDTVLDWEDALPPKEMVPAENHCRAADLVLCLGTSLQITPACNLPLKSIRGGGKIAIINLQVIAGVMDILNLRIPPYIRIDFVQLSLSYSSPKKNYVKWIVRIESIHGTKAPLPFVKSVEILFSGRPDLKAALLQKQPFYLKRETARNKPFKMILKFNLGDGCGCPCTSIEWEIDFQAKKDSFVLDKEEVVRKLRDGADEESRCGQTAVIQRQALPRAETTVHAVVTNMMRYDNPEVGHAHEILSNKFINEAGGHAHKMSPKNSFKEKKRGIEAAGDREASPKKPKLAEAAPSGPDIFC